MSLTLIDPPAVEPLTLAEAKAHLRFPYSDEDTLIEALISAAREMAESTTQRALVQQTWRQIEDQPPRVVLLRKWPVLEVVSIKADGVAVELAAVETVVGDNACVAMANGSIWPGRRLEIEYRSGFGADGAEVPKTIKQWMLLQVGTLFENRETLNVGNIVTSMPHVSGLIDPWRVWNFA